MDENITTRLDSEDVDSVWKCSGFWPISNGNQQRLTELIGSALSDDFTLQGTWDSIDGLRFESQSQLTNFTDIMELSS